ncbi:MAG: SUMF1/EgtB/PvdO family nonheme iron enzyme, partial [Myxococcota bacterium]|nr:SUMF1/EgtB/PvdO family nonheme iron enzyme [Myxococcota bacterium]
KHNAVRKNVRRDDMFNRKAAKRDIHPAQYVFTFNTYHDRKGIENQSPVSQCTSLHNEEDTGISSCFIVLSGIGSCFIVLSNRVIRGGSWDYYDWSVRVASRNFWPPGNRYDNMGFRFARTVQ